VLSGRIELEYLICDGASTDNTLEIVRSFSDPRIKVSSIQDGGMYEALARGLSMVTGDICAYLNAGDYYHKTAFDVVAELFRNEGVLWLTGMEVSYNEKGQFIRCQVPFKYRREFIQKGIYGTKLHFVQQESTFWSRELLRYVDLQRLAEFRLAGDGYLWHQFSTVTDLYIVASYLGGFRQTPGQLSATNLDVYLQELATFSVPGRTLLDHARVAYDRLCWHLPPRLKKALNRRTLFTYSTERRGFV